MPTDLYLHIYLSPYPHLQANWTLKSLLSFNIIQAPCNTLVYLSLLNANKNLGAGNKKSTYNEPDYAVHIDQEIKVEVGQL